jgi:hypothetical protein
MLLAFTWFLKHTSTLTYVKCLAQVHHDHGIWKVLGVYVAFKMDENTWDNFPSISFKALN